MNLISDLEKPILRENPILGNDPFGLEVRDILILKQKVENNVQKLHSLTSELTNHPSFNKQSLREHQKTIQYFDREKELLEAGTPEDMLQKLRQIYNRVAELGYAELTADQIGKTISNEFPEDYHRFHEILRGDNGPHFKDGKWDGMHSWLHSLEGHWQAAEIEKIRVQRESQKPTKKLARLVRSLLSKNKLK